jgi:hypothetical protein
MKIVDASWEEKNIGLKTCEIVFERGDTFEEYLSSNIENNYQFSVVKIPVGDLTLVHQLEEIGYRYLENQLLLTFDADQSGDINPKWDRLTKGFSCKLLTTKDELKSILREVSSSLFETDRFSLDPIWDEELSSKRYQNWITDLFESGKAQFYVIAKDGNDRGFFSIKKESDTVISCPIAGIYKKYKSSGYIYVLTRFWFLQGYKMGSKKLITSISSNNRIMLSSISKVFSFAIKDINIILRKVIVKR